MPVLLYSTKDNMTEIKKEDVNIQVTDGEQSAVVDISNNKIKEYSTDLILNSFGVSEHRTNMIEGTLKHFIFQTESENELDIIVHPVDFPELTLHIKSMNRFGIYTWKVVAVNNEGEEITAPPEWSDLTLNDILHVRASGGQEGTVVRMVIRYD